LPWQSQLIALCLSSTSVFSFKKFLLPATYFYRGASLYS
jgi:hypothetical protein